MKKALQIYHLMNILHIVFYAYILVRALNIGNARAIIQGNSVYILVVYLLVIIGLSMYARRIGDGLQNPMRTVKWARILHFISLAFFVTAFVLFQRYSQDFIYLILVSFPIDIIAFILAYRGSVVPEKRSDLIDDFLDESKN